MVAVGRSLGEEAAAGTKEPVFDLERHGGGGNERSIKLVLILDRTRFN
jgi:hypothetical protein